MAASSSTTTSAAANPDTKSFDVFINHRGVDTKKTLANLLHRGLDAKGFSAFIDNKEMQQGYAISAQIQHAVKTASVHLAVFSPRYAESVWCLDELVLMLESQAPIIPIFYRVKPEEVRWQKGNYAEALQSHEQKGRYDSSTIQKWKETLHKVASSSGFPMEECSSDEELGLMLDLVDKVVISVSQKVKRAMPDLYVAEYPTGLDYTLKDFEDEVLLPQQQRGNPQIFGIMGLGGVGKTTLAKEFFNRKKSEYAKSCFLFEVKDNAANLPSLQSQLFKSLTGLNEQVDNVHKGKGMLIGPLKSYKALVIIDDVDDEEQVKALLPVQTHELCSGTLILITSRDRDVLRSSRVEQSSIYTLTKLEKQHSLELFCSHAFQKTYPPREFKDLVDMFLAACEGLPLSLTIFGALLYGRDISEWEDKLERLQQILPNKIKDRLKISYDALQEEEQQIFLDIACFFIGEYRHTAIGIWNSSGWKGRPGFQTLQNKSLVEVDSENVIHMHNHVRDMGREVAEVSPPRRICRWTKNVIDKFLQPSSEITVRGIQMVHSEHNGRYNEDDEFDIYDSQRVLFERIMRSLQILDTKGSLLEPIFRRVESVPNLMWLRWENCPHSSLPSCVQIKNLRVLKVSKSLLKTLWQREGKSQAPVCLEELWIDKCVQLKSIRGLEQATKLRVLSVVQCSELEELPSMETLASLEKLYAQKCVQLKSIRGLEQATKLRKLYISECSELEELPRMESFVSLEELYANGCARLKSIRGLAQCTKLRELSVKGCSELKELPSMETLASLEELYAQKCVQLKSIRGLEKATKLRRLYISECSELEELPSMETLTSLEELWANDCVQLKSIKGLEQATNLRELIVGRCSELEELPSMESFVSLEKLYANGCARLKSIRGLAQCTKLRELSVKGCSELKGLPSMETLASLEKLYAQKCVQLKSIRGLEHATKLRKLYISECSELEELPRMESFVSLEELYANGCARLKSIRGLAQCTKLRELSVKGCSELKELPSMETLASLEKLYGAKCLQLKSIRGLKQATKLRQLSVWGCPELEEVEGVEDCTWLEILEVFSCAKLKCPVWE